LGKETKVIATGGLGPMIGTGSKYIKTVDDLLTLEGLRIIWERNVAARPALTPKAAPSSEATTGTKNSGTERATPRSPR
jgi:type III pantothenate kinase